MAKYPETNPTPNYPLTLIPKWRTITTPMESGKEQRRAAWVYPQWDVVVSYSGMESTDTQNLYTFYMDRQGSYDAFHIYDLALHRAMTRTHTGLFVTNIDSTIVTYDLPGRSITNETIYVDGTSISSSTYSITSTSGDSDADQLVFDSTQSTSAVITCDFTGYLRIRARFAQDSLPFELFEASLQRTGGINLIGLAST